MLVDLSDTTNWHHTETDHIIVEELIFNVNPTSQFVGLVEVGYLTNVDATGGDFYILYTLHEDKSANELVQTLDFRGIGLPMQDDHFFGPSSDADALFQTDVNLQGPDGNTSYPSGNGDLVMKVTRTNGNVDISIMVLYVTVGDV